MGIIILPYLLGAIIVAVISIAKVFVLLSDKKISLMQLELGLLASIVFFALILLSYLVEKKVYALSPMFRVPMYMIILPSIIAIAAQKTNMNFSTILLTSASISAILIAVFNKFVFRILEYLPVSIYH